ncbi:hypothetical protein J1605_005146 [Eschrichtius robustus]|uniref:DUF3496 domain-containing protein n=1 Tax=Eschrichtius robustus TaxID=9764 RepID=A0AB34HDM2_ESCRO|nr:hypothetical protein J1605_005146 [Eschrichtius robustus]
MLVKQGGSNRGAKGCIIHKVSKNNTVACVRGCVEDRKGRSHLQCLSSSVTGARLQPVRKQAAQQEVSGGRASKASPAAPHRSPSLALPPEHTPPSVEKLSSTKLVPGAEKVGDRCSRLFLSAECLISLRTNERLAEISTKLLVEKQQNRSLLSTLTTRPVLEPPCVGNLNNSLVLNRNLTPGENLEISTSSSRPSNKSMETYLTKMQQEMEKNITRELEKGKEYNPFFFFSAAAECESGSYRASPLGATDESNLNQDLVLKTSQEYVQILKKNYMI